MKTQIKRNADDEAAELLAGLLSQFARVRISGEVYVDDDDREALVRELVRELNASPAIMKALNDLDWGK